MIVDICINLFCPCILFGGNMSMFFHVQQDSVSSMDLPQDFVADPHGFHGRFFLF